MHKNQKKKRFEKKNDVKKCKIFLKYEKKNVEECMLKNMEKTIIEKE